MVGFIDRDVDQSVAVLRSVVLAEVRCGRPLGSVVLRPAGLAGHSAPRTGGIPDSAADSFARLGLLPPVRHGVLTNPYSLDDDLEQMEWVDGEDEPVDDHDGDEDHVDESDHVDGVDEAGDATDDVAGPTLEAGRSFEKIAHDLGVQTSGDRVFVRRFLDDGVGVRLGKVQFIHLNHGATMGIKCTCEQHSRPGQPCFLLLPAMNQAFDKYEAALKWLLASDRNAVGKDDHLQMASDIKAKFHAGGT